MNSLKKTLISFLITIAVTLSGIAVAHGSGVTSLATDVASQNLVVRGGVIRIGTDVYVHQNSAHAAAGITGIRLVNGCDLQLDLDRQPDERIMAAIAEEDETISRLGVQAGVSGGNEQANIYLYKAGKKICANDPMFGSLSNLWVQLTYIRVL